MISNQDAYIDTYEVKVRIKELERSHNRSEVEEEELKALKQLLSNVGDYVDLIRQDVFVEHAKKYAYDILNVPSAIAKFVNWEDYAESIKENYSSVIFYGKIYYYYSY